MKMKEFLINKFKHYAEVGAQQASCRGTFEAPVPRVLKINLSGTEHTAAANKE